MQLGLRRRQPVDGLRLAAAYTRLLFPVAVGAVRQHTHGCHATVEGQLLAVLARLFVAEQQSQRAAGKGALAEVGIEQPAIFLPAAVLRRARRQRAAAGIAEQIAQPALADALLRGLEQMVEESLGLHARSAIQ